MAMPSFDIVSEIDKHELKNALDQASRELANRFDFKGSDARFEQSEMELTLIAPAEFQLQQMLDILKAKLTARKISLGAMEIKDPVVNLAQARQTVLMKQGIEQKLAKDLIRKIKDARIKVECQIQGEKLRVTGKKRDDLQGAIALLRAADIEQPLQYENFRD
jgi:cyclic-di-GMP-binding protein